MPNNLVVLCAPVYLDLRGPGSFVYRVGPDPLHTLTIVNITVFFYEVGNSSADRASRHTQKRTWPHIYPSINVIRTSPRTYHAGAGV